MNQSSDVKGWKQLALVPARNVRIRAEVVISDHGLVTTWHVRAVDEADQSLIAAWTLPLRSPERLEADMHTSLAEFVELVRYHVEPFPDI